MTTLEVIVYILLTFLGSIILFSFLCNILNIFNGLGDKIWKSFWWPIRSNISLYIRNYEQKSGREINKLTNKKYKYTKIGGNYYHVFEYTPNKFIVLYLEDGVFKVGVSDYVIPEFLHFDIDTDGFHKIQRGLK